jgi:hypothetical protein
MGEHRPLAYAVARPIRRPTYVVVVAQREHVLVHVDALRAYLRIHGRICRG